VAIVTNKQLPDVVTGDFDSLRDDVREFYRASGVKVIHDPDQYATDFMKSVKAVDGEFGNGYRFIAMPSVGSRVDHNFHAIHMLFALRQKNQLLFLVSNESITFLLDEGDNEIITPQSLLGKTCGIIPIVGPTIITTHGLEWDVTDWPTSFGTQVSTSNHLVDDIVRVKCSKPSLFTVEIRRKANGTLPQAPH
jgi:thiamine pyrophosphokinase